MGARAYAVTGAVIVSDDCNTQVKYHPQCPKCGYVAQNTTCSGYVAMNTRNSLGGFNCFKCGTSFIAQINRGC